MKKLIYCSRIWLHIIFTMTVLGSFYSSGFFFCSLMALDSGGDYLDSNEVFIYGNKDDRYRGVRHSVDIVDLRTQSLDEQNKKNISKDFAIGRQDEVYGSAPRGTRGLPARYDSLYLEGVQISNDRLHLINVDYQLAHQFQSFSSYSGVSDWKIAGTDTASSLNYEIGTEPVYSRINLLAASPRVIKAVGYYNQDYQGESIYVNTGLWTEYYLDESNYRYYANNATPFNVEDDRFRLRKDLGKKRMAAGPVLHFVSSNKRNRVFVLSNVTKESRKVSISSEAGSAETDLENSWGESQGSVEVSGVKHKVIFSHKNYSSRLNFLAGIHMDDDSRATQRVSPVSPKETSRDDVSVKSKQVYFLVRKGIGDFSLLFSPAWINSSVLWTRFDNTERYEDSEMRLSSNLRWRADKVEIVAKGKATKLLDCEPCWDVSYALNASYELYSVLFFLQGAKNEKRPSLLEQFGDGSYIKSSPGLAKEVVQHREFGVKWLGKFNSLSLSGYRSDIQNKIVFLPDSLGFVKAENVGKVQVDGAEWRLGTSLFNFDADLSYGWQRAVLMDGDVALAQSKLVPFSPTHKSILHLTYTGADYWQVDSLWRYQSHVYQDSANSIRVGALHFLDLGADYFLGRRNAGTSLSFKIANVLNVRSVTLSSNDETGRQGYWRTIGQPLTGRQFQLAFNWREKV